MRWSHGARKSAASARVLRYHQWSSSTAAMRAYSSSSTRGEGTGTEGLERGDACGVDDEVGRRPRLHADPVTGGAVAAAVGERLQRLGTNLQVLVVTHSPQVAARGAYHWRVAKSLAARQTVTRVEELDDDTRQEEIARMLSGRNITAEARAAAASLIAGGRA